MSQDFGAASTGLT